MLRKTFLVSLDDLLAVVREFLNPNVSRSGLDRCLRRHGVGNLRDLKAKDARPKHSGFKAYEPGYIHIDVNYLPKMADESSRREWANNALSRCNELPLFALRQRGDIYVLSGLQSAVKATCIKLRPNVEKRRWRRGLCVYRRHSSIRLAVSGGRRICCICIYINHVQGKAKFPQMQSEQKIIAWDKLGLRQSTITLMRRTGCFFLHG